MLLTSTHILSSHHTNTCIPTFYPIPHSYNRYCTHSIPDEWRTAVITPKFKNGSPSDPANYRPISLACLCCKIFESMITSQVLQFLQNHHLITKHLHGSISRQSTSSNLYSNASTTGPYLSDYMIITSKTSETIKLRHYTGINQYSWIKSFQTSRTQIVKIDSSNSLSCPLTSDVVQASKAVSSGPYHSCTVPYYNSCTKIAFFGLH